MHRQHVFSPKFALARFGRISALKAALLVLAMIVSNAETVSAGERVTFETPAVQPSAFKIKRAKAKGITVEPTPGITLSGILSKPEGPGPHPAVVLLPESVEARPSYVAWADYLTDNGFVTLIVESLVSRGETILRLDLPMNLLVDASGAIAYLSTLESVDRRRVGLIGFGVSGEYVQRLLHAKYTRKAKHGSFFAGVAIYPHCDPNMALVAPILVLAGGKDKRISMASCQSMVDLNKASEARTKLQVYPQATHFFDNIAYAKNPELHGKDWVEPISFNQNDYDPKARASAEREVLEFFKSAGAS